ncbi:uncharacterized protein LOC105770487 [Gossypium raimondii]|uniref:uncharacterized protein LOC105770487 n=1 Tax=Gossypium raimondii TaxID=29730 RepID=UPI00227AE650|nr:uncharacterized protein LOC105770487 [Gossypium raimondii]
MLSTPSPSPGTGPKSGNRPPRWPPVTGDGAAVRGGRKIKKFFFSSDALPWLPEHSGTIDEGSCWRGREEAVRWQRVGGAAPEIRRLGFLFFCLGRGLLGLDLGGLGFGYLLGHLFGFVIGLFWVCLPGPGEIGLLHR